MGVEGWVLPLAATLMQKGNPDSYAPKSKCVPAASEEDKVTQEGL